MKNILIAWELGGGLGHAANLAPIAKRLSERGHTLHIALRDLSVASRVFGDTPASLWQAPFKNSRPKQAVPEPRTFADILFNCGFGDPAELHALVRGWLGIFRAASPGAIVAEHSPAAMLAARIVNRPVVLVGTGFCSPPASGAWRDLRPWSNRPAQHIPIVTARVLAHANEVLRRERAAPLRDITELFSVAATCLQTVPQLDPYAPRSAETYHAAWPHWGGKTPAWPAGKGKRLFAYLKPFPALPQFLALLAELHAPAIVVCDGIDQRLQKRFARPWLVFENEPLDMRQATTTCDVAICNGNHGTTLAILQAGKPGLYLPLHLEQTLTSYAMQQRGAGAMASIRRPEQISIRLLGVLQNPQYLQAAQSLAAELRQYDSAAELERVVGRVEQACG